MFVYGLLNSYQILAEDFVSKCPCVARSFGFRSRVLVFDFIEERSDHFHGAACSRRDSRTLLIFQRYRGPGNARCTIAKIGRMHCLVALELKMLRLTAPTEPSIP